MGGGALAQGYAVVSQDSGHNNAINVTTEAGTATFGYDPRARIDFGYRSYDLVTRLAQEAHQAALRQRAEVLLLRGLFGGRPRRPGDVAAFPRALRWHRFRQSREWICIALRWRRRMRCRSSRPRRRRKVSSRPRLPATFPGLTRHSPTRTWSPSAMRSWPVATRSTVSSTAASTISKPAASIPRLLGPGGTGGWTPPRSTALANVFAGPRNRFGRSSIRAGTGIPGIAATAGFISWRNWKMGAFNPTLPFPPFTPVSFNTAAAQSIGLGGASVPFLFRTPPNSPSAGGVSVNGAAAAPDALMPFILSYSFDRDAPPDFRYVRNVCRVGRRVHVLELDRLPALQGAPPQTHRLHRWRGSGVFREVPRRLVSAPGAVRTMATGGRRNSRDCSMCPGCNIAVVASPRIVSTPSRRWSSGSRMAVRPSASSPP